MADTRIVDPSELLQQGQDYTFAFKHGFNPIVTEVDLLADLRELPELEYLTVNQHLLLRPFQVAFTYAGSSDFSDLSVADEASKMIALIASKQTFYTPDFIDARTGTLSDTAPAKSPEGQCSLDNLSNCLPSTTVIIFLVIGLGLFVFLVSGGPALTRSLAPSS
jgi:hypothetical protein